MSTMRRSATLGCAAALALWLTGCEEPAGPAAAPSASAPKAAATPTPVATAAPSAAEPEVKPSHPCPEGSEGKGTFKEPCKATGPVRAMEATWTGKITDEGPSFKIVNKTKLEILYGHVFVYFYDKDGKQLVVPGEDAKRKKQGCGGNIFAGPMKAGETAVLWFSCVAKKHVPEGATKIEAELKTVGFTAPGGGKSDTFWQNADLAPDDRPLGGVVKK